LAIHAIHTFRVAKSLGTVVIVTNGETGWVELSCQKFMPSLVDMLRDVKILSARSTYEPQGVESPFEWKRLAFLEEVNLYCQASSSLQRKNLISVGDSLHEREALIRSADGLGLDACFAKALKLIERPRVEQLANEHELLAECFTKTVRYEGHLDLVIEV